MEPAFLDLLAHSPWVGVTAYLLWRLHSRETAVMDAYREGMEWQKAALEAIRELEKAVTALQAGISDIRDDLREERHRSR